MHANTHTLTHIGVCPLLVQQRWGADMWSRKYQIPSVKVPFPWLLLTVAKRDHHYHIRELFGVLGSDRGRSLVPGPPYSWRSLKSHACLRGATLETHKAIIHLYAARTCSPGPLHTLESTMRGSLPDGLWTRERCP